jgi:hypothetical protein
MTMQGTLDSMGAIFPVVVLGGMSMMMVDKFFGKNSGFLPAQPQTLDSISEKTLASLRKKPGTVKKIKGREVTYLGGTYYFR